VPPVWPSPAATADVEVVPVAPAQPKDDSSSARMQVPWEAQAESWTPGPRVAQVESGAPRRAWWKSAKQAMKEPRGRFDHLGGQSDRQSLFLGRSNRLGSQ
jgi:hypothetical protein